jgi:signal transduction histidine kinase
MSVRDVVTLLGVLALYVGAGKLGLALATINESATAIWPPTGIAIAAFLLLGRRMWPAIAVGAFAVNVTTTGDAVSSLGIALGNTLEGLAGAYLAERFAGGRRAFFRLAMVLRYVVLVALGAPVVSASIGVATLIATGHLALRDVGPVWITWWIGDAGGAMLVAPLVILWAVPAPMLRSAGSTLELAAFALATGAIGYVVFAPSSAFAAAHEPIGFLVFPVLMWPVVRFGPRVGMTTAAALSALAVYGHVRGVGPWVRPDANESLLLLAGFMATAVMTSLAVGAIVIERQRAEESLRATEEHLRRAEESKVAARDEFLQVAAHELRTPLTSLQLATDLLLKASATDPVRPDLLRNALAPIASQTKRLNDLVSGLLDTVRIEADRMDLALSHQDLGALTERVAREWQAATPRREIQVDARSVEATVDPLRYEQVVRNLIDNAVKHGGGRIEIGVAQDDGRAQVWVRDHGAGIALEHRDHIFDRFYRANGHGGGLGLGLHLSKRIVELHGGDIRAEFPSDGGTRMVVTLPA